MFSTLYEAVKGKTKGQKLFLHKKKSHKPNVYGTSFWQGHKDSNSGHVVLETTALPTELYPYINYHIILLQTAKKVNTFFYGFAI